MSASNSTTQGKPRKPRFVRITETPDGEWVIRITEVATSKTIHVDEYLARLECHRPGESVYKLEKIYTSRQQFGERFYGVIIHVDDFHSSCDCYGYASHGHCKHVAALTKAIEKGKLPALLTDDDVDQDDDQAELDDIEAEWFQGAECGF